jgi:hypothetical protein
MRPTRSRLYTTITLVTSLVVRRKCLLPGVIATCPAVWVVTPGSSSDHTEVAARDRHQTATGPAVALNGTSAAGIEHVHEVAASRG